MQICLMDSVIFGERTDVDVYVYSASNGWKLFFIYDLLNASEKIWSYLLVINMFEW